MENTFFEEWLTEHVISKLNSDFEVQERFYEHGDFGSLRQINFDTQNIGGNVDFWGKDWLGVFVYNYKEEKELLNVLIEANHNEDKQKALDTLEELLIG